MKPEPEVSVVLPMANSSIFVLPTMTAQPSSGCDRLCRNKPVQVHRILGHRCFMPSVHILSFTAIGTPARRPDNISGDNAPVPPPHSGTFSSSSVEGMNRFLHSHVFGKRMPPPLLLPTHFLSFICFPSSSAVNSKVHYFLCSRRQRIERGSPPFALFYRTRHLILLILLPGRIGQHLPD